MTKSHKPTRETHKKKPDIPKGGKKKDRLEREDILIRELTPLKGKHIRNISTGKAVKVTGKSIKETAHHASKSRYSSVTALGTARHIKKAKPVKTHTPKSNQSQRKASSMLEMRTKTDTGSAKVMVEVRERQRKKKGKKGSKKNTNSKKTKLLHYCVTGK